MKQVFALSDDHATRWWTGCELVEPVRKVKLWHSAAWEEANQERRRAAALGVRLTIRAVHREANP